MGESAQQSSEIQNQIRGPGWICCLYQTLGFTGGQQRFPPHALGGLHGRGVRDPFECPLASDLAKSDHLPRRHHAFHRRQRRPIPRLGAGHHGCFPPSRKPPLSPLGRLQHSGVAGRPLPSTGRLHLPRRTRVQHLLGPIAALNCSLGAKPVGCAAADGKDQEHVFALPQRSLQREPLPHGHFGRRWPQSSGHALAVQVHFVRATRSTAQQPFDCCAAQVEFEADVHGRRGRVPYSLRAHTQCTGIRNPTSRVPCDPSTRTINASPGSIASNTSSYSATVSTHSPFIC